MEAKLAADLKTNIAKVIVGKDEVVELLLTAILPMGMCCWRMCRAQGKR